jgi:hypothetical protein
MSRHSNDASSKSLSFSCSISGASFARAVRTRSSVPEEPVHARDAHFVAGLVELVRSDLSLWALVR